MASGCVQCSYVVRYKSLENHHQQKWGDLSRAVCASRARMNLVEWRLEEIRDSTDEPPDERCSIGHTHPRQSTLSLSIHSRQTQKQISQMSN